MVLCLLKCYTVYCTLIYWMLLVATRGDKTMQRQYYKTHIFNLEVGKQRVKIVSHTPPHLHSHPHPPPPPHNVAHGWNF